MEDKKEKPASTNINWDSGANRKLPRKAEK